MYVQLMMKPILVLTRQSFDQGTSSVHFIYIFYVTTHLDILHIGHQKNYCNLKHNTYSICILELTDLYITFCWFSAVMLPILKYLLHTHTHTWMHTQSNKATIQRLQCHQNWILYSFDATDFIKPQQTRSCLKTLVEY